jgi:hypothetical protein
MSTVTGTRVSPTPTVILAGVDGSRTSSVLSPSSARRRYDTRISITRAVPMICALIPSWSWERFATPVPPSSAQAAMTNAAHPSARLIHRHTRTVRDTPALRAARAIGSSLFVEVRASEVAQQLR